MLVNSAARRLRKLAAGSHPETGFSGATIVMAVIAFSMGAALIEGATDPTQADLQVVPSETTAFQN